MFEMATRYPRRDNQLSTWVNESGIQRMPIVTEYQGRDEKGAYPGEVRESCLQWRIPNLEFFTYRSSKEKAPRILTLKF